MLPFLVCLLCLVFFGTALRNLFGCLDGNGCTDFPSQQKSFVKLADISMLCDNMTRWPLTHLCCLKQLCPKNLRATKMFFYVRCWNLFENLSVGNVFSAGNTYLHTMSQCSRASLSLLKFPRCARICDTFSADTSVCFKQRCPKKLCSTSLGNAVWHVISSMATQKSHLEFEILHSFPSQ